MNQKTTIEQIYAELQRILPAGQVQRLKFASPDQPPKHKGKVWRGRIYSADSKSIFGPTWCFYEIGIGRYAAAPTKQGGVGFVCYTGNKQCGSGAHSATVVDVMSRFASTHPHFPVPKRGDKKQVAFTYYSTIPPLNQPVRDLSELIRDTFDSLDRLQNASPP